MSADRSHVAVVDFLASVRNTVCPNPVKVCWLHDATATVSTAKKSMVKVWVPT